MSNSIYSEYVEVSEDLDRCLKKCFLNHLVAYNYSLYILHEEPDITFKTMMKMVVSYIEEKHLTPVIHTALMNELYYQYKKFKRNIRMQKLVSDIQYFTILSKGYVNPTLHFDLPNNTITVESFPGIIKLNKPLPQLLDGGVIYVNFSYSGDEDKYKMSIHSSKI